MTRLITASALAASLLTVACSINELPSHAGEINHVEISISTTTTPQLFVEPGPAPPPPPDGLAPDPFYAFASSVESDVVNRLNARIASEVRRDVLRSAFENALDDDFRSSLPQWQVIAPVDDTRADARFLFDLDRIRLVVDSRGMASVEVTVSMNAILKRTGETIYRDWNTFRAPVTDQGVVLGVPNDFLRRHYQLLELDRLSHIELTRAFYAAADQAASAAIAELVADSFDE